MIMKMGVGALAAAFAVFSFSAAWAFRILPGPQDGAEAMSVTVSALDAPPTVGALRVLGAWRLEANDARFGGWSDLRLQSDGEALVISDQGYWMAFAPPSTAGEASVRFGVMRDSMAAPLASKQEADAEGLALLPDGRALVSFEGRHRIDAYDLTRRGFLAAAAPGPNLAGLARLGSNSGAEALTVLPDGRVFAGAEGGELWVVRADATEPAPMAQRLSLPLGWMLTAASAQGEMLYLVWRFFNPITRDLQADIRRCPLSGLDTPPLRCERLAVLAAPFPVDNFESIEAEATPDGVRLTILSDDNYSAQQRTVLVQLLAPTSQP